MAYHWQEVAVEEGVQVVGGQPVFGRDVSHPESPVVNVAYVVVGGGREIP